MEVDRKHGVVALRVPLPPEALARMSSREKLRSPPTAAAPSLLLKSEILREVAFFADEDTTCTLPLLCRATASFLGFVVGGAGFYTPPVTLLDDIYRLASKKASRSPLRAAGDAEVDLAHNPNFLTWQASHSLWRAAFLDAGASLCCDVAFVPVDVTNLAPFFRYLRRGPDSGRVVGLGCDGKLLFNDPGHWANVVKRASSSGASAAAVPAAANFGPAADDSDSDAEDHQPAAVFAESRPFALAGSEWQIRLVAYRAGAALGLYLINVPLRHLSLQMAAAGVQENAEDIDEDVGPGPCRVSVEVINVLDSRRARLRSWVACFCCGCDSAGLTGFMPAKLLALPIGFVMDNQVTIRVKIQLLSPVLERLAFAGRRAESGEGDTDGASSSSNSGRGGELSAVDPRALAIVLSLPHPGQNFPCALLFRPWLAESAPAELLPQVGHLQELNRQLNDMGQERRLVVRAGVAAFLFYAFLVRSGRGNQENWEATGSLRVGSAACEVLRLSLSEKAWVDQMCRLLPEAPRPPPPASEAEAAAAAEAVMASPSVAAHCLANKANEVQFQAGSTTRHVVVRALHEAGRDVRKAEALLRGGADGPPHVGVTCDACGLRNFGGTRWKCEVCKNYDLCDACHGHGLLSYRHTQDHPMRALQPWLKFRS